MIQILEGLDALGNPQYTGVVDGVPVNVQPMSRAEAAASRRGSAQLGAFGPQEAQAAATLVRVGFFVGVAVGIAGTIFAQRGLERWKRGGR